MIGASIVDYWISVEVQSGNTAAISSTVVTVPLVDTYVWITVNYIHSNHVIHIYNFISATRAIIITIFTREPRNQVGVA